MRVGKVVELLCVGLRVVIDVKIVFVGKVVVVIFFFGIFVIRNVISIVIFFCYVRVMVSELIEIGLLKLSLSYNLVFLLVYNRYIL